MPKNYFMQYEAAETPVFESALFDNPVDISDWAEGYAPSGKVVLNESPAAKELKSKFNLGYENVDSSDTVSNPSSYSSSKTNFSSNQKTKIKETMDNLISRGLKPHQAAGVVGNLLAESSLNSGSSAKDVNNAMSGGLAMWNADNFAALKQAAKQSGVDWKDHGFQLDYLWNDYNSSGRKDVRDRLNAAKSIKEASDAWAYYEKYAGYNYSTNTARKAGWSQQRINQEHEKRAQLAQNAYDVWNNG